VYPLTAFLPVPQLSPVPLAREGRVVRCKGSCGCSSKSPVSTGTPGREAGAGDTKAHAPTRHPHKGACAHKAQHPLCPLSVQRAHPHPPPHRSRSGLQSRPPALILPILSIHVPLLLLSSSAPLVLCVTPPLCLPLPTPPSVSSSPSAFSALIHSKPAATTALPLFSLLPLVLWCSA
jgi:hypothetical protein